MLVWKCHRQSSYTCFLLVMRGFLQRKTQQLNTPDIRIHDSNWIYSISNKNIVANSYSIMIVHFKEIFLHTKNYPLNKSKITWVFCKFYLLILPFVFLGIFVFFRPNICTYKDVIKNESSSDENEITSHHVIRSQVCDDKGSSYKCTNR